MNPVYSPASTGVPFTNTKGMGYPGNCILLYFIYLFIMVLVYNDLSKKIS